MPLQLVAVPVPVLAPVLRLVPTPSWEPPYDDEAPADRAAYGHGSGPSAEQGTLALTFLLPSGVPVVPDTPALRLVESTGPAEAADHARLADPDDDMFSPQPTSRADLPDPQFWAGRLAQAMLEVDAGVRPVTQLRRWTSDEVYARLRRRSHRARFVTVREPGRQPAARVLVRSVRVCEPADGIAEASAVVYDGRRTRGIAFRLEGTDGRWRCTALEQN
jgi:hypothetical protein